jgi:hypothetical protein
MTRRHITRTTFADGSTVAELFLFSATDVCPHCGAAGLWSSPRGDLHVCTRCRRGFELERAPHIAADNQALAQVVKQLETAG